MSVTQSQVIVYARTFLNVPFRHQGRDPQFGLDCIGLIIRIARHFNFSQFDTIDYPAQPDPAMFRRHLEQEMDEVLLFNMQLGDVVFCADFTQPHHVALFAGAVLIHAWAGAHPPRVVETSIDRYWQRSMKAAYRFRGLSPVSGEIE